MLSITVTSGRGEHKKNPNCNFFFEILVGIGMRTRNVRFDVYHPGRRFFFVACAFFFVWFSVFSRTFRRKKNQRKRQRRNNKLGRRIIRLVVFPVRHFIYEKNKKKQNKTKEEKKLVSRISHENSCGFSEKSKWRCGWPPKTSPSRAVFGGDARPIENRIWLTLPVVKIPNSVLI